MCPQLGQWAGKSQSKLILSVNIKSYFSDSKAQVFIIEFIIQMEQNIQIKEYPLEDLKTQCLQRVWIVFGKGKTQMHPDCVQQCVLSCDLMSLLPSSLTQWATGTFLQRSNEPQALLRAVQ